MAVPVRSLCGTLNNRRIQDNNTRENGPRLDHDHTITPQELPGCATTLDTQAAAAADAYETDHLNEFMHSSTVHESRPPSRQSSPCKAADEDGTGLPSPEWGSYIWGVAPVRYQLIKG